MKAVIDRFEEGYAVAVTLGGEIFNIKTEKLPKGVKEGDVVILGDTISIDAEETEKRRKSFEKYLELWEE